MEVAGIGLKASLSDAGVGAQMARSSRAGAYQTYHSLPSPPTRQEPVSCLNAPTRLGSGLSSACAAERSIPPHCGRRQKSLGACRKIGFGCGLQHKKYQQYGPAAWSQKPGASLSGHFPDRLLVFPSRAPA